MIASATWDLIKGSQLNGQSRWPRVECTYSEIHNISRVLAEIISVFLAGI